MSIKQLSVFVENKQGRLAEITQILHKNRIDIRALSIADTTHFGILRLIVNRPDEAEKALKEAGMTVSLTEVIAIGVEDQPGGLAAALECLTEAEIAVEYMYAFISRAEKTAFVILRVVDNEKASEILSAHGVTLLKDTDIYDM